MKPCLVVLAALSVLAAACAHRPPRPREPVSLHVADATARAIDPVQSLAPNRRDLPDRQSAIERDAAHVFRAMHADLLRCFARATGPAHLTIDVVVGPDGDVRHVTSTGGARLGSGATTCMERRIAQATFPAPSGGGTARVQVPFAFSYEPDD